MSPVENYKLLFVKSFSFLLMCSAVIGVSVPLNPLHFNKVLEGPVLDAKKVPTISVCIYECLVTTDCQSFNFYMDEGVCVFNAENSSTAPQCLSEATGKVHYSDVSIWPESLTGACSGVKCPPGQRCYPVETGYTCLETATTGMDSCEMTFLSVGNDRLPDSALTASTSFMASHGPERGRLNTPHGESYSTHPGGWSAAINGDNQWIQVDLQELTVVRGVMTQGRNSEVVNQWVTQFRVLYSADCNTWTYVGADLTDDDSATVFPGNADMDTVVTNMFVCPFIARCVRVNPVAWNQHVSMRFDIIGCPTN